MKEKNIQLKIDGLDVSVAEGTTILEAAQKVNVKIPTLCYHQDLCVAGNCRICVVEQIGRDDLIASCATPVAEGMDIITNSQKVRMSRKNVVELLLSEHNADCTHCYKNQCCEFQALSNDYLASENSLISLLEYKNYTIDHFSPSIVKNDSKCIRCQRCVRTCEYLQGVSALTVAYRGKDMKISTFFEKPMYEVVCTNCGQCVNHCPTGALTEKTSIDEVWDAIYNKGKHVVVQTAPAVRITLGETLGEEPGTIVTGKMVAALRRLGFDSVLDTDFTADLTIMEEGSELLQRLEAAIVNNDTSVKLPLITSCSPGWIKYIEHTYSDCLGCLSTCKSPQQMFGALAKTYYAKKIDVDPEDIVSVSIMPCTAKKFEADRPEMCASGYKDVDYVLTTRELGRMIRQAGIDFESLPDEQFDSFMGKSTGAGVIFGATGGVMEAAVRTVYELVTGREVPFDDLNILPFRGLEEVKQVTLKIENVLPDYSFLEGVELKACIAHGLVNAQKVMDLVSSGEAEFHFVEIMACQGGCLGGGGQPIPVNDEIRKARNAAIYKEDADMPLRKSHENPEVIQVYREFLKKPLGHKSHELLHTSYIKRHRY